MLNKINIKGIIKTLSICLSILIILFIVYRVDFIKEILIVLLFSFIIAYALKPLYCYVVTHSKINKRLIAITIILMVILFFAGIFSLLIPRILNESLNLEQLLNSIDIALQGMLNKFNIPKERFYEIINIQFGEKINAIVANLTNKLFYGSILIIENIIALAIVPVVAYYFLVESTMINNKIMLLISSEKREIIKNIARDIDRILGKYILGQGILCLIVALLSFFGLMIIDVKFALILSILNGILNIIPYFGPILGIIPAMLVALIDSPSKVFGVIIVFLIIQQLEGNILAPKVTANSISMHPLVIIILLLIGEKVGGLLGMILIVPIAIIIKVLYDDLDYYCF